MQDYRKEQGDRVVRGHKGGGGKGKGKGWYSSSGEPHLRATDVTCHMGSHSVTCHPTQVNAPRLTPAMQAGTRFT